MVFSYIASPECRTRADSLQLKYIFLSAVILCVFLVFKSVFLVSLGVFIGSFKVRSRIVHCQLQE